MKNHPETEMTSNELLADDEILPLHQGYLHSFINNSSSSGPLNVPMSKVGTYNLPYYTLSDYKTLLRGFDVDEEYLFGAETKPKEKLIIDTLQELKQGQDKLFKQIGEHDIAMKTAITESTNTVVSANRILAQQLYSCMKMNPALTLGLFSNWGLVLSLFFITVSVFFHFHIINPLVSLLILFSSVAGLGMASVSQKTNKQKE